MDNTERKEQVRIRIRKEQHYLKTLECLPFGERLMKELDGLFGERLLLGKKLTGQIIKDKLSILKWKSGLANNFYYFLFTTLDFDELNIGGVEDKKVKEDYYNNRFSPGLNDEEKLIYDKHYNNYVAKRFFEKFPYLEQNNNLVSRYMGGIYSSTILLLTEREFHKKMYDVVNELRLRSKPVFKNQRSSEKLHLRDIIIHAINTIIKEGRKPNRTQTYKYLKANNEYSSGKSTFYDEVKDPYFKDLY